MRIGISELFTGEVDRQGRFLVEASQLIEELGYHALWFPEHVVFFPSYDSQYPYGTSGQTEVERLRGVYDPFTALAAISQVTSEVRLGTYVCVLAQRNPIVTARDIATLDQVSGGRFDFGVGVGWSAEEYRALGVPFERRGARTDDYLAAMKRLWADDEVCEYHGEFVDFEPLMAFPKPLQRPHPPVVVGGNSSATIRRIVQHGQGWAGYNLSHDEVAAFLERLDVAMSAAGRSLDELELRVGRRSTGRTEADWQMDADYIAGCERLGLHEVVVTPRLPTEAYERTMRRYAEVVGLEPRR
jgi:probable F420-dependent oxidoreductase